MPIETEVLICSGGCAGLAAGRTARGKDLIANRCYKSGWHAFVGASRRRHGRCIRCTCLPAGCAAGEYVTHRLQFQLVETYRG